MGLGIEAETVSFAVPSPAPRIGPGAQQTVIATLTEFQLWVFGRTLRTLEGFSDLIQASQQPCDVENRHYPHFADSKAETQRGEDTHPRSHSQG